MADFRLYNTMTRKVEPFAPADGETVRIYSCGPTVYNPAHLGNFRTFLFVDLLRRALKLRGWKVRQVMNLTDVDDKIIKRAHEQRKTIREVTEPVSEIFHRDREYLRIERAEAYPKATDYIPQMIALVAKLIERGVAYVADDKSVYFAIDRFPAYGRLSRLDKRELKTGARVAQDDYSKENAQDFALWKAATPNDEVTGAAWDSPWGRGRPGWHLECSAMAIDLQGETLDIHCGGIDLIFPHHEDEIAQSEAATGATFSRFWCHGAFLLIDGAKMAKSAGNLVLISELLESYSPEVVRLMLIDRPWSQPWDFTPGLLDQAAARLDALAASAERSGSDAAVGQVRAALRDDLDVPRAINLATEAGGAAANALMSLLRIDRSAAPQS